MKNKEKAKKIYKLTEESGMADLFSDLLCLKNIKDCIDEMDDIKLKKKFEAFFEQTMKEFEERDIDEEKKVEFYCENCKKFFPLADKSATSSNLCKGCQIIEDEEDDWDEEY